MDGHTEKPKRRKEVVTLKMRGLSEHKKSKLKSMQLYCKAYQTYKGKGSMSWGSAIKTCKVLWDKKKEPMGRMRADLERGTGCEDTVKEATPLSTPTKMSSTNEQCEDTHSRPHRRRHHHGKIRERGYIQEEFKKAKAPTFNGEMRKSKDVEASLLGMKKFFEFIII